MYKNKDRALQLRRSGMSYKRIKRELGIPTSTLSGWFKNEPWSQAIKIHLSNESSFSNPEKMKLMALANKERWETKREGYRNMAAQEFKKLKNDPLFLAGIMLYWGEGEKQQKYPLVRMGNSEPEMIRIFYLFLIKTLKLSPDKISAWLLLYPDLIDSVQKNFWSRATGIPIKKFTKSIYIKGRHPKKRLSYGVCTVFVSSRALKERVLVWLELYKDFLRSYAMNIED